MRTLMMILDCILIFLAGMQVSDRVAQNDPFGVIIWGVMAVCWGIVLVLDYWKEIR